MLVYYVSREGETSFYVQYIQAIYIYANFQVRLAITSVWKAQFQPFGTFLIANNEHFRMVCSTQKVFFTRKWTLFVDPNPLGEMSKFEKK